MTQCYGYAHLGKQMGVKLGIFMCSVASWVLECMWSSFARKQFPGCYMIKVKVPTCGRPSCELTG